MKAIDINKELEVIVEFLSHLSFTPGHIWMGHTQMHREKVFFRGAGPVDGSFDIANSTGCKLGGHPALLVLLGSLLQQLWIVDKKQHVC